METYTIKVTPMAEHITKPSDIYNETGLSKEAATRLFQQACERFNLDNATENEAGGIGYDYRAELIAEQ